MGRLAGFGACCVWFLWTDPLAAKDTVRLRYEAPASCPPEADFRSWVSARHGRFDVATAAETVTSIDVAIDEKSNGFEGSLRVEGGEQPSGARTVHDASCAEVAKGLAVVAAIALGASDEEVPPVAVAVASPPAPAASSVEAPKPTTPAAPEGKPRLRGTSVRQPDAVPTEAGTLRFDRDHRYTLAAGVQLGLVPSLVLPRYDFTLAFANFVTPPAGSTHLVGPIMQLGWSWLGPATRHTDGYATQAIGMLIHADPCFALSYDTAGLNLLLCTELSIGFVGLQTKDSAGKRVQSKDVGIGAGGVGLDAQYSLGSLFHVGLRVGAQVQFGDVSAERADGSKLFDGSAFGGYALAGVGLHF